MTDDVSRRAFLKRASALSLAGAATPLVTSLAAIGEAAAAGTPSDYKALVCVFMYGGNDYANTLVPYDNARYAVYQSNRSAIALAQAALTPTLLNPSLALPGQVARRRSSQTARASSFAGAPCRTVAKAGLSQACRGMAAKAGQARMAAARAVKRR